MKNLKQIFHRMTLGLVCAALPMLGGCANTITWQEEVKLLDGRVIAVTQKRRIDANQIPREFWLTFMLPEFGDKEIAWYENLGPQVLNVYQGKLYLVASPFTEREFRQYGRPMPSYIGYCYVSGQWKRISFNEIPDAIYDTNLLIANMPPNGVTLVTTTIKIEEMKDETIGQSSKRIDQNSTIH
jgi:hypothetical protein